MEKLVDIGGTVYIWIAAVICDPRPIRHADRITLSLYATLVLLSGRAARGFCRGLTRRLALL